MSEPKGFAEWTPREPYKSLVPEVQDVIEASRDNWPLTQRTYLYQLMGKFDWIKVNTIIAPDGRMIELQSKRDPRYNHRCEDSLQYILSRGRRAGLVSWKAIAAGRGVFIEPGGFSSAEELADTMLYSIKAARSERQAGQGRQVALWIETEGMVPLVEGIASDFGAFLGAGQGFDTLTNKYELAVMIALYGYVLILHVGDLDPSGHTICKALGEDLSAFASKMGGHVEVQRIALLEEQVHEYSLPSVPRGKPDKSNHGKGFDSTLICQAEALHPEDLLKIIRQAFEQSLDMDLFEAQVASEAQMRKDALKRLRAQR